MTLGSFAYPDWLWPVVLWSAAIIFVAMVVGHALRPKYRRLYGGAAILKSLRNAILPSIWVQIYMWLALILVWTPVWWLAVLVSGLTGLWTPTGWFVTAFVLFYAFWFIRGVTGHSVNHAFYATAARDAAPAENPKRVAVRAPLCCRSRT